MDNYKWHTVLLMLILSSCKSQLQIRQFSGIFVNEEVEPKRLILDEYHKFTLEIDDPQKHLPIYFCCDTIATGVWKVSKKSSYIVLDNTDKLDILPLSITAREEVNSADSLTFLINSPIERDIVRFGQKRQADILYSISMYYSDGSICQNPTLTNAQTNKLSISKEEQKEISYFEIEITPSPIFRGRNIGIRNAFTSSYYPKNKSSNSFEIYIDGLTYEFMTEIRLMDDILLVENFNQLIWDGKRYYRQ
ncbi:MAG: hypothetical protein AAFZ63_16295 [Bacteroidota bacterium]